jgi:hypothetical protein
MHNNTSNRATVWFAWLLLPVLALMTPACGGEVDEEGQDEERGLNLPDQEGERVPMASCPNGGKSLPAAPTTFTKSIDGYATYVGQTKCNNTPKAGVVAFRSLVLKTYPCTGDDGIARACSVGGQSEHKEGRAWDWAIHYPHPAADTFLGWLLATDKFGNKHAMARRLGIMYMIWNHKIWKSYQSSKGWQTYTGSNPHTDHVHFSFSWDGANKKTSFWNPPAAPPPPSNPPSTTPTSGTTPASLTGEAPVDNLIDPGVTDGDATALPDDTTPWEPPASSSSTAQDHLGGGCSLGPGAPLASLPAWLLAAGLLALVSRRRG